MSKDTTDQFRQAVAALIDGLEELLDPVKNGGFKAGRRELRGISDFNELLQRLADALSTDPAAARTLIAEMGRIYERTIERYVRFLRAKVESNEAEVGDLKAKLAKLEAQQAETAAARLRRREIADMLDGTGQDRGPSLH